VSLLGAWYDVIRKSVGARRRVIPILARCPRLVMSIFSTTFSNDFETRVVTDGQTELP